MDKKIFNLFLLLLLIQTGLNIVDGTPLIATTLTPKESELLSTTEIPTQDKGNAPQRITSRNKIDTVKTNVTKIVRKRPPTMRSELQAAAKKGIEEMTQFYDIQSNYILNKGLVLPDDHPGAQLSRFSATIDGFEDKEKAAYAFLIAAKELSQRLNTSSLLSLGRESTNAISLKRTPLEAFCPPRETPRCSPATKRYRTHDGTCNNDRRPRWGSAQMPYHRFLPPDYDDGVEALRLSVTGSPLPSARFISLLVHGSDDGEAPVTLMLAQWGQFIDHDIASTAQPRNINNSIPRCCDAAGINHPSCAPIQVPSDDPWLGPLNVDCLEFLRSAPARRSNCLLSWREQTNQVTPYLDGSAIYSSNPRTSDNARIFRNGLLLFGKGPPMRDTCFRGSISSNCIRAGDARSGEQPGLLAMHHVFVTEHNQIALELAELNPHWSDEKIYQETRRIIGAIIQHITYREFLPLVLGDEVCKLFDLDLMKSGYYQKYSNRVNPGIANSFAASAFRFGHSLVQGTYLRADQEFRFFATNVSLHDEFARGDMGEPEALQRLLRGMSMQRAQKRDEFITPELTNHLFQSGSFPFGLDLAAINIQRGRDHGLPSYVHWREPCGLASIHDWEEFAKVVGPGSANRIRQAYNSIRDVDLFVAGLAERPVVGGLVGPTFACIIAQQFSNLRRGDRFWYENPNFESSFTPNQLDAIRRTTLAQIICRRLGHGALQPNIFLPPDVEHNVRLPCGIGPLAPIELNAWRENDSFDNQIDSSVDNNIDRIDGVKIQNKLDNIDTQKVSINKISDKIDLTNLGKLARTKSTTLKPVEIVTVPNPISNFTIESKSNKSNRIARTFNRFGSQDQSSRPRPIRPFPLPIGLVANNSELTETEQHFVIKAPSDGNYDIEIKLRPKPQTTNSQSFIQTQPSNNNGAPLFPWLSALTRPIFTTGRPLPPTTDNELIFAGITRPSENYNYNNNNGYGVGQLVDFNPRTTMKPKYTTPFSYEYPFRPQYQSVDSDEDSDGPVPIYVGNNRRRPNPQQQQHHVYELRTGSNKQYAETYKQPVSTDKLLTHEKLPTVLSISAKYAKSDATCAPPCEPRQQLIAHVSTNETLENGQIAIALTEDETHLDENRETRQPDSLDGISNKLLFNEASAPESNGRNNRRIHHIEYLTRSVHLKTDDSSWSNEIPHPIKLNFVSTDEL